MSYFKQFFCSTEPEYSVVIEDDDKVCYAYLYFNKEIIGDVWLYNNVESPAEPEWASRENLPFLNPVQFVSENLTPFDEGSDVIVDWSNVNGIVATIFVTSRRIAKLSGGAFPGWSSLVSQDGPLAKKMHDGWAYNGI